MTWDLEEKVEDALIAYLRTKLSNTIRVYPGWSHEEVQHPCVIVISDSAGQLEANAPFSGHRLLSVKLAILVEAKISDTRTPRQVNREIRGEVVSAFASDTAHESVNAIVNTGIAFSQVAVERITRSVEGNVLVSTVELRVIAQPTEA